MNLFAALNSPQMNRFLPEESQSPLRDTSQLLYLIGAKVTAERFLCRTRLWYRIKSMCLRLLMTMAILLLKLYFEHLSTAAV